MHGSVRLVDDVPGAFAMLVRERRPRAFAISGGATARACYQRLAAFPDAGWEQMEVLVGDERWVPVDDPDSNEGMAREALLDHVPVRSIHSARQAGGTLDEAAAAYNSLVSGFDTIDLIHLGLGEDGHTASLFPGSRTLEETQRLVVATADDAHPHPRLTFTYPALERGRLVVFTVAGADKREAFARVRAGEELPASRVRAAEVVWLVDRAAAGAAPG